MQTFFILVSAALVLVLLLPFYRVLKGPTVFDRLLGAAAVGAKIITLVLLFGEVYGRPEMFVDIALGYAVLNFIGVIAIARYFRTASVKRP